MTKYQLPKLGDEERNHLTAPNSDGRPNGPGAQLRRTTLIGSVEAQAHTARLYHGSIKPSGAVSAASAMLGDILTRIHPKEDDLRAFGLRFFREILPEG